MMPLLLGVGPTFRHVVTPGLGHSALSHRRVSAAPGCRSSKTPHHPWPERLNSPWNGLKIIKSSRMIIWRCPKLRIPPSRHPFLHHFGTESHGDLGIFHFKKPPFKHQQLGSNMWNENHQTDQTTEDPSRKVWCWSFDRKKGNEWLSHQKCVIKPPKWVGYSLCDGVISHWHHGLSNSKQQDWNSP